jgi:hypothetical protein
MSRMLTGSCLCGAVRYEVADEFEYALICHCSQCRRATGAAAKPFAGIGLDKVDLTKGTEAVLRFGSELAHDVRCGICGGFLYSVVREARYATCRIPVNRIDGWRKLPDRRSSAIAAR